MTQRSVTYLKGRFETGDIPTQSDYGDLMDSFVNLEASAAQTMAGPLFAPKLTGKVIRTTENITASGTSQSSAAAVSADCAQVSAEQNERACVLAALEPGRTQFVVNTGTTVLQVYPPSGQNFVGTAANGGINCAVAQSIQFVHNASAFSYVRSN
jgi:hypothetical protein